jgi:hypothetical protein
MEQYDLEQGQGFEQVDADAVCEQCGTVNDEGTLLCKTCGNNLRDQRSRRIAEGGGPDLIANGKNHVQILTGLLVILGILVVFYAVWNIDKFEAFVAASMTEQAAEGSDDLWAGTNASYYDEMLQDLVDNPTPQNTRKVSLDNPQAESSYNGRYLIMRPGALTTNRIIGEAHLKRLGNKVLFVYLSQKGDIEARGYAQFESTEGSEAMNVTVRQTSEVRVFGLTYVSMGIATPIAAGGHSVFAMRDGDEDQHEALAYRVHNNF